MKKLKFKVVVNAFTRDVVVLRLTKNELQQVKFSFTDLDSWDSFTTIDNRTFDIHFHYDEQIWVSIYETTNGVKYENSTIVITYVATDDGQFDKLLINN